MHEFVHGFCMDFCMDFSVMVSPRVYSVFWMTEKSMHAWIVLFFVLFWVLVGRFFMHLIGGAADFFARPIFQSQGEDARLMPRGATPEFGRCAAPWHGSSRLATRRAGQTQSARRTRRGHSPRTASPPQRGHPARR